MTAHPTALVAVSVAFLLALCTGLGHVHAAEGQQKPLGQQKGTPAGRTLVAISPAELEALRRAHNITAPPSQRNPEQRRAVNISGQICTFTAYVDGVNIGGITAPFPAAVSVIGPGGTESVGSVSEDALFYLTALKFEDPVAMRIEMVSDAFLQAGALALVPGLSIFIGDDLHASLTISGNGRVTYERPAYRPTPGGAGGINQEVFKLLNCEPGSGPCCDEQGYFRDSSTVCRAATSCTYQAFCTGDAASCPVVNKADRTACPWRPMIPRPSRHHYTHSGAEQKANQAAADEVEVAGTASNKPSYGDSWPECQGTCLIGVCALLPSHPECCYVRGGDYDIGSRYGGYPAADHPTADASGAKASPEMYQGYWRTRDLFCWE